ncbi:CRE-STO-2 protein [Aphelenchoides bicaudatus]|nr:CRE-STO-2 protein [Aphelenchoides bicaudatus]
MFRRSSSERTRVQNKPLRYRSRPQAPIIGVGVQSSGSSPAISQRAETTARRANLPLIRLEARDSEDSDEEDTNERSRLMSGQPGLLREPSGDDEDERLQSVHIDVPSFPIATATFRRPRSSSIIGSRHSSIAAQGARMGRRFTLNPLIFAKEEREARRQSLAQLKLSYYPKNTPDTYEAGFGFCSWILLVLSYIIVLATFPISICFCVKVVQEYERVVLFRLGRLIGKFLKNTSSQSIQNLGGNAKGPGIFFVLPCIESFTKVDLRTVSFSIPPQEILTRDSVTISVDAVVYYRIINATVAVANVENAHHSTRLLAQTALRNLLGTRSLSQILSDLERVEIKDVRLPVQLQRLKRPAKQEPKVVAADGEEKASRALKGAADVISQSPNALQLRYLQTLSSVASEKNSTIVFPLPVELIRHFLGSTKSK